MMNLCVTWKPLCGYYLITNGCHLHLTGANILFYDEECNITPLNLSDGCQFWFRSDIDKFNFRKKENFTRKEIFAIKGREYGEVSYKVYIPIEGVKLNFFGKVGKPICEGYYMSNYECYALEVSDFIYWGNGNPTSPNLTCEDNLLYFKVNYRMVETLKQTRVNEMIADIEETCDVSIDEYTFKKIIKYYDIVKK